MEKTWRKKLCRKIGARSPRLPGHVRSVHVAGRCAVWSSLIYPHIVTCLYVRIRNLANIYRLFIACICSRSIHGSGTVNGLPPVRFDHRDELHERLGAAGDGIWRVLRVLASGFCIHSGQHLA